MRIVEVGIVGDEQSLKFGVADDFVWEDADTWEAKDGSGDTLLVIPKHSGGPQVIVNFQHMTFLNIYDELGPEPRDPTKAVA